MITIQAPSSKSISHRMLMGAALAQGTSTVSHVLMSKDIERTMNILHGAGARFTPHGHGNFEITGMPEGPRGGASLAQALDCDVHESGTTCRLLTSILAAGRGCFRVYGAPRMHQRPMEEITTALQSLGVDITFEEHHGYLPFTINTQGLQGDTVRIGMDDSSQYLSGLLLAAPLSTQGLTISLTGNKVVSWPYVGLTLQTLEDFGIPFRVEILEDGKGWLQAPWRELQQAIPHRTRFCIPPALYKAGTYSVEGDWSGASYFVAAGAIGTQPLCVTNLRVNSLQGDRALMDILMRMGARIENTDKGIVIYPSTLYGITVDMAHCPDLVPTVAMLAAFAHGRTTITNTAHLRIKESDRIAAPAQELARVGVNTIEHDDGLSIDGLGANDGPRIPQGTVFHAHGDHRIAMACALLGLGGTNAQKIQIDDPQVVHKSFPHFWELWNEVIQA